MTKSKEANAIMESESMLIPELVNASGKVDFPLTNDVVFRMDFNRNEKALKGFICSLLRISVKDIRSVMITNPELSGYSALSKESRLDINVLLNDETIIDIEMQVVWNKFWKNRTLVYLCRDMDNIQKGGEYSELKQAIHVGILNNVPKGKSSGFYSKYMLVDVGTNETYSDKLILYVMDLGKIDEATEDDVKWGLVSWARLLTAKTWEEVKMAATNDEYITEAANTLYILSAEYQAKKRALEREDYLRYEKYVEETIKRQAAEIAEKDAEIAELKAKLAEKS